MKQGGGSVPRLSTRTEIRNSLFSEAGRFEVAQQSIEEKVTALEQKSEKQDALINLLMEKIRLLEQTSSKDSMPGA